MSDAAEKLVPLDALRGLDSAVVQGFLDLPAQPKQAVIDEYTTRYGEAAGAWLGRASTLWPEQRLGVSRVTLARLFAVLPGHMSQSERLDLAKSIWHVARAPTQAVLRVPAGFRNHGFLSTLVREHFLSVLPSALEMPQELKQSVPWLSDPAMTAQHDVLNLLLIAERDQLLLLADEQIEVLFARRLDGLEIRSTLTIAGHKLVLRTDADIDEPTLRLRHQSSNELRASFDTRASRSALIGGLIGCVVATAVTALIFWLN